MRRYKLVHPPIPPLEGLTRVDFQQLCALELALNIEINLWWDQLANEKHLEEMLVKKLILSHGLLHYTTLTNRNVECENGLGLWKATYVPPY